MFQMQQSFMCRSKLLLSLCFVCVLSKNNDGVCSKESKECPTPSQKPSSQPTIPSYRFFVAVIVDVGDHRYHSIGGDMKREDGTIQVLGPKIVSAPGGSRTTSRIPAQRNSVQDLFEVLHDLPHNMENSFIIFLDGSHPQVYLPDEKLREKLHLQFFQESAQVVFAADDFCWPNKEPVRYEYLPPNSLPCLNAGAFYGHPSHLKNMLKTFPWKYGETLQSYFTRMYANSTMQRQFRMTIDWNGNAFYRDNKFLDTLVKSADGNTNVLPHNLRFATNPPVVFKNAEDEVMPRYFDRLFGLLYKRNLQQNNFQKEIQSEEIPELLVLVVVINLVKKTPFLELCLSGVTQQKYDKKSMFIVFETEDEIMAEAAEVFAEFYKTKYIGVQIQTSADDDDVNSDRIQKICQAVGCEYVLFLDGRVVLENPLTFSTLVKHNSVAVAPVLGHGNQKQSEAKAYVPSEYSVVQELLSLDKSIAEDRVGLSDVFGKFPAFSLDSYSLLHYSCEILRVHILLLKSSVLSTTPKLGSNQAVINCLRVLRKKMSVSLDNSQYFGHLINMEFYNKSTNYSDAIQIFFNTYTWEVLYLHQEMVHFLRDSSHDIVSQPCRDIYTMPVFSSRFSNMIYRKAMMDGTWSTGIFRADPSYPPELVDYKRNLVYTSSIDFDRIWLRILQKYIMPTCQKAYHISSTKVESSVHFFTKNYPELNTEYLAISPLTPLFVYASLGDPFKFQDGTVQFHRSNKTICQLSQLEQGTVLFFGSLHSLYYREAKVTTGESFGIMSFVGKLMPVKYSAPIL